MWRLMKALSIVEYSFNISSFLVLLQQVIRKNAQKEISIALPEPKKCCHSRCLARFSTPASGSLKTSSAQPDCFRDVTPKIRMGCRFVSSLGLESHRCVVFNPF